MDIYLAGRWSLPNTVNFAPEQQAQMWEALRNALGLPEGFATALAAR